MMEKPLWNRDNGGTLEAGGDNCLAQGGVKDVCEDIYELFCTVLKHMTRNVVNLAQYYLPYSAFE